MINGKSAQKIVRVAVAVLQYGEQFLLARRGSHQHQGDKFEFVGGKIEPDESPRQALVREVFEEIGLSLDEGQLQKMGVLTHDYGDKVVELHIHLVAMNAVQYADFAQKSTGSEGQSLHWFSYDELLQLGDELPQANLPILTWLTLPKNIVITRPIADFANDDEFVRFYAANLWAGRQACYIRPQSDLAHTAQLAKKLMQACERMKIKWILGEEVCHFEPELTQNEYFLAIKLSAGSLATQAVDESIAGLNKPFLVSVHDEVQAQQANLLANRLPLIGAFVSPVLPTLSHSGVSPLGWQGLQSLGDMLTMPVIALGGLSWLHENQAWQNGAITIAGIRNMMIDEPF